MNMQNKEKKRVCFFGIYDPEYTRNRVLRLGFKENGYTVEECRVAPSQFGGIRKYYELYKKGKRIDRKEYAYIIVNFPGQTVVWLARLLFGKEIIFDAFLSFYDSNVNDRNVYGKYSVGALRDWLLDWFSCKLALRVLLDTQQHIEYFNKTFGTPKEKCIRVLIGADTSVFYPRKGKTHSSHVSIHFHGNFIPLQGVSCILEAARTLRDENIIFNIVGDGSDFAKAETFIKEHALQGSVILHGEKPYKELSEHIQTADICLGIFGDTEKTRRVIPNKVYECIAMQKPVVTADTPALREVFTPGIDVAAVPAGDADALAAKIRELVYNPEQRGSIAEAGHKAFCERATPTVIGKDLLESLSQNPF